jgi:hypothetical protein
MLDPDPDPDEMNADPQPTSWRRLAYYNFKKQKGAGLTVFFAQF